MNFIKIAATALTLAFGATVAVAQGTTPPAPVMPKAPVAATTVPPAAAATTPAKGGVKKATTVEGQACSTEADAKGLHGKARKSFRAKCIKEKMAAAAPKKS